MKRYILAAAVLALSACGESEEQASGPEAPPPPGPLTTAPTTPSGVPLWALPLNAEGWGDVKIGIGHEAAVKALGKVVADPSSRGADWDACHIIQAQVPQGLWVMVENGKVTRVTLEAAAKDVKTDAGIRVGDPVERVLDTYPNLFKREPHKYLAAPAEYLTWWSKPEVAGIRYVIGEDRKVASINAGGPSIRYVEGCS